MLRCGPGPPAAAEAPLLFGALDARRWGSFRAFVHGAPPQAILLNCRPPLARGARLGLLEAVPRRAVRRPAPPGGERYGWDTFKAFNPSLRSLRRGRGGSHVVAWRHTNHNNCHNFFQPIAPNKEDLVGVALLDSRLRVLGRSAWLLDLDAAAGAAVEDCRPLPPLPGAASDARAALRFSCWAVADAAKQDGRTVLVDLALRRPAARAAGSGEADLEAVRVVSATFPFSGRAKNINFFVAPLDGSDVLWAEFSLEPHRVCAMDLASGACGSPAFESSAPVLQALARRGEPAGGDVMLFRGGACCVPARRAVPGGGGGEGAPLLLGVGHVRRHGLSGVPYQYSHFFYAFEAEPPFRVRLASPEFCLLDERTAPANASMQLRLLGPPWRSPCPYLQFVAGIEEAPPAVPGGDPGDLILSYGELDCTAHVAVLSRELVLQALLPV